MGKSRYLRELRSLQVEAHKNVAFGAEMGSEELHRWGRQTLLRAFPPGQDKPSPAILQIVGALAYLQTKYGTELAGSNNWLGDMGKPRQAPCDASFYEKGGFCYQRYATPEDGAAAFWARARRGGATSPLSEGDVDSYAKFLLQSGSIRGTDADAATFADLLAATAAEIAQAVGEPFALTRTTLPPTGPNEPLPFPPPSPPSAGGANGVLGFVVAVGLGLVLFGRGRH